MLRSFRHRGLQRHFERGEQRRLPAQDLAKLENIVFVSNRAGRSSDMDLPGFRLHPLRGDLAAAERDAHRIEVRSLKHLAPIA